VKIRGGGLGVTKKEVIENVSGVLVAGGKSRRMGSDKRFLELAGKRVFDRTLALLEVLFSENFIVLAEPVPGLQCGTARIVYDRVPNAGSLGGLYTGLLTATHERSFAVACDMPFLDPEVIRFMASFDPSADVVVAEVKGQLQPLHAMYSRRCTPFLRGMADQQDLKIQHLFRDPSLRVSVVRSEDLEGVGSGVASFQNINTPEDLARITRVSRLHHGG